MKDDIFGYSWADIKRAQMGGRLASTIDVSKPARGNTSSNLESADDALLEKYGERALRNMGYYGVIDRLEQRGIIQEVEK